MRVVAGSAGGLRLVTPPGADTRPTSDRVREATFNALGSLDVVEDATVLDLFAGSGAMGIEALSRGARHATFIERGRPALHAIAQNLRTTGFDAQATVVATDALGFAAAVSDRYDLAICDPPYTYAGWDALVRVLPARVIVLESDRELEPGDAWEVVRQKRYGTTVVTIARRRDDRRPDRLETPT
jgi:16S rRNA (guanine966-N2)-methyltransferase